MSNVEAMNTNKTEPNSNAKNQWIVSVVSHIPLLTYGILTGWISPMSILLRLESNPAGVQMSLEVISWMASIGFLAAALGIILYGYLMDRFGRKPALLVLSLPYLIAILMKITILNPYALIVARIFCGVSFGGSLVVPPAYVKEVAEVNMKEKIDKATAVFEYAGILFIYIISTFMEYRAMLYLILSICLLHTFASVWIPETPYYLVNRGKIWDATKAVSWLRDLKMNSPAVKSEINRLITKKEELADEPEVSHRSVLRDEAKRNAAIITASLLTIQTAGGSYATIAYASFILQNMGSGSTVGQAVVIAVALVCGVAMSARIREWFPRRLITMAGYSLLALCFLITAVLLYLHKQGRVLPDGVPTLILSVAMFAYGCGVASMPYVVMEDMFALQYRAKIWRLCLLYSCFTTFISVKLLETITEVKGMYVMYFIYASINIFGVVFTKFYIPETRSKNVEEIEELLRKK